MIAGYVESEVAALVRALVDPAVAGDLDRDAIADRFARARWSGIAEPGDADAGRLIAALGPVRAVELLDADPHALAEHADGAFEAAVARWRPRVKQVDPLLHLRQAARFGARLVVPGDAH